MVRVYPRLNEYCQSTGYDFQVVDMRWGVRDEATADHMTTELCMKELKLCQDISTGPNFVVRYNRIYLEGIKFRDLRIFLKTVFSRVLNFGIGMYDLFHVY